MLIEVTISEVELAPGVEGTKIERGERESRPGYTKNYQYLYYHAAQ